MDVGLPVCRRAELDDVCRVGVIDAAGGDVAGEEDDVAAAGAEGVARARARGLRHAAVDLQHPGQPGDTEELREEGGRAGGLAEHHDLGVLGRGALADDLQAARGGGVCDGHGIASRR